MFIWSNENRYCSANNATWILNASLSARITNLLIHMLTLGRVIAPTPGNFSVIVKGILPNGKHFVKLAMYSFQSNANMQVDLWYWDYDQGDKYSGHLLIGSLPSPIPYYQCKDDENKYVIGMDKYHKENFTRIHGTWARNDRNIHINLNHNNIQEEEEWHISWEDGNTNQSNTLYKIELIDANYVGHRDRFYLQSDLSRSTDCVPLNVGWGFGVGGETEFGISKSIDECHAKNYYGLHLRHNSWLNTDENIVRSGMLLKGFYKTNNNVLKHLFWDCKPNGRYWVFSYFAIPDSNSGRQALRRVIYQTSHDFDNDGHISNDIGHIYSGIQVLDSNNQLRGFVFADVSPRANAEHFTVSAMYYLDSNNDEAHIGVRNSSLSE